jgi:hypothetical protein
VILTPYFRPPQTEAYGPDLIERAAPAAPVAWLHKPYRLDKQALVKLDAIWDNFFPYASQPAESATQ